MLIRSFVVLVAVGVVASIPARTEEPDVKAMAKAKANEMRTAFVEGDIGKYVDLYHPKYVERSGGREKLIFTQELNAKWFQSQGTFKFTLGNPSEPIQAGKDLYVIIPFALDVSTPEGRRVFCKSGLVGVSSDNGKTWVFVDTCPGRDAVKQILPDLPDKLPIPKTLGSEWINQSRERQE
ncbi:MAG: hypothetical protein L0241_12025 [Planctomycetia bacterium]|nr:hypothetical protein [Planctomycetia bacterium]